MATTNYREIDAIVKAILSLPVWEVSLIMLGLGAAVVAAFLYLFSIGARGSEITR